MSSAETITSHSLIGLNSREDSIRLTNLLRANDTWGWMGWTLFLSEANDPHMTDSYCNWIELTRREFSYLMDLIPALNRDGLPQELNH
jgi:hypothetical protein